MLFFTWQQKGRNTHALHLWILNGDKEEEKEEEIISAAMGKDDNRPRLTQNDLLFN